MTSEPAEQQDPNELIQMNVRVPRSLKDAVDGRRQALGLSRDAWVRNAMTWALRQPPGTPVTGPGRRTAPTQRGGTP